MCVSCLEPMGSRMRLMGLVAPMILTWQLISLCQNGYLKVTRVFKPILMYQTYISYIYHVGLGFHIHHHLRPRRLRQVSQTQHKTRPGMQDFRTGSHWCSIQFLWDSRGGSHQRSTYSHTSQWIMHVSGLQARELDPWVDSTHGPYFAVVFVMPKLIFQGGHEYLGPCVYTIQTFHTYLIWNWGFYIHSLKTLASSLGVPNLAQDQTMCTIFKRWLLLMYHLVPMGFWRWLPPVQYLVFTPPTGSRARLMDLARLRSLLGSHPCYAKMNIPR